MCFVNAVTPGRGERKRWREADKPPKAADGQGTAAGNVQKAWHFPCFYGLATENWTF